MKALTARLLFERDVHYLVRDGKIVHHRRIYRPHHAGSFLERRPAPDDRGQGRLRAERPARSVARITYQRFFTRYQHLCGMSGTLAEVGGELRSVYGVGVARIPTHHPRPPRVEKTLIVPTAEGKWRTIAGRAVASRVRPPGADRHPLRRRVATGERPAHGHGVAHSLLNAAQDAAEAEIVARAGEPAASPSPPTWRAAAPISACRRASPSEAASR